MARTFPSLSEMVVFLLIFPSIRPKDETWLLLDASVCFASMNGNTNCNLYVRWRISISYIAVTKNQKSPFFSFFLFKLMVHKHNRNRKAWIWKKTSSRKLIIIQWKNSNLSKEHAKTRSIKLNCVPSNTCVLAISHNKNCVWRNHDFVIQNHNPCFTRFLC